MSYSQPAAGGDGFAPADHNGRLLLVYPKAYDPNATTKHSKTPGDTQAADVDIIIIDELGPNGQPVVLRDTRLFGNLARSVRVLTEPDGSPKKYLGRLGQEDTGKGSPAWVIRNWTDQDVAMCEPVRIAFEAGQLAPAVSNPMSSPAAAPAVPAYGAASSPAPPAATAPQAVWTPPPAATEAPVAAPNAAAAQWQPSVSAPAAPAPVPAPAAAATAVDPNLVAFLQARGVTVQPGMDQATCEAIAKSFPQ